MCLFRWCDGKWGSLSPAITTECVSHCSCMHVYKNQYYLISILLINYENKKTAQMRLCMLKKESWIYMWRKTVASKIRNPKKEKKSITIHITVNLLLWTFTRIQRMKSTHKTVSTDMMDRNNCFADIWIVWSFATKCCNIVLTGNYVYIREWR